MLFHTRRCGIYVVATHMCLDHLHPLLSKFDQCASYVHQPFLPCLLQCNVHRQQSARPAHTSTAVGRERERKEEGGREEERKGERKGGEGGRKREREGEEREGGRGERGREGGRGREREGGEKEIR